MSEKNKETIVDNEILPGMQFIYGDREDKYQAHYIPDVKYVSREERDLHINLIVPQGSQETYPLLVFIQGSAWFEQDNYMNIPQLSYFAHQGYVVASVEYRPSFEAVFPAQIKDVKTAIRFLKANADKYNINSKRVAVAGDSSGGHLALLAGLAQDESSFHTKDFKEISDLVQAVIDFYGPTDLLKISEAPFKTIDDIAETPESKLVGGNIKENKAKAEQANPINYIKKDKEIPPVLIMHGDQDSVVPFNQSVLLYQALREQDKNVSFYKVKGAGHGRSFWTEELLGIVVDFLEAYI